MHKNTTKSRAARAALALLLIATPPIHTAAAQDLTLLVTTPGDAADTADTPGTLAAFHADMARALCAHLDAACTLEPTPPQDAATAAATLAAGEADAILAVPAPRLKSDMPDGLLLTAPLYNSGARFTRHKNTAGRIGYKRMAGKTIAVVQNTRYAEFAAAKFEGANIQTHPTLAAAREALTTDKADYLFHDRTRQHLWTTNQPDYEQTGSSYTAVRDFPRMAIAAATPALQQSLTEAIAALHQSGDYQRINKDHFPFSMQKAPR